MSVEDLVETLRAFLVPVEAVRDPIGGRSRIARGCDAEAVPQPRKQAALVVHPTKMIQAPTVDTIECEC